MEMNRNGSSLIIQNGNDNDEWLRMGERSPPPRNDGGNVQAKERDCGLLQGRVS